MWKPNEIKTSKYADKVDPLTEQEYESLKQSLLRDGFWPTHKIIINQSSDVLDGHHRLKACRALGIEPLFVVQEFEDPIREELFVYDTNLKRRQLNEWQRAKIVLKEKPLLAKLAERNMKAGKTLSGNQQRVHVHKDLAKKGNMSKDAIYKVDYVLKKVEHSPDKRLEYDYNGRYRGKDGPTYAQVEHDANAGRLTRDRAYHIIRRDENIKTRKEKAKADAQALESMWPSDDNNNGNNKVLLLNKDSTNLEDLAPDIPDNSVDLIVTDPPYANKYLGVYEGLAKLAKVKLKEGGSLVFFYTPFLERDIHNLFAQHAPELTFWWHICVNHTGNKEGRLHGKGVLVGWKRLLWFVKGNKRMTGTYVLDYVESEPPDKALHPWAQGVVEAEYLISKLTISEDSVVMDPFLGSGTFGIAATKHNRYFVGIELDKQTYENACNNILLYRANQEKR